MGLLTMNELAGLGGRLEPCKAGDDLCNARNDVLRHCDETFMGDPDSEECRQYTEAYRKLILSPGVLDSAVRKIQSGSQPRTFRDPIRRPGIAAGEPSPTRSWEKKSCGDSIPSCVAGEDLVKSQNVADGCYFYECVPRELPAPEATPEDLDAEEVLRRRARIREELADAAADLRPPPLPLPATAPGRFFQQGPVLPVAPSNNLLWLLAGVGVAALLLRR